MMKIRIFVAKEKIDLNLKLSTALLINRFVLQKLLEKEAKDSLAPVLDREYIQELKALLQRLKQRNGGSFPLVDVETAEGEMVRITL